MAGSSVERVTEEIAVSWLSEGRRVVQAVLVEVEGSAPLPVGATMLIDSAGAIEGSNAPRERSYNSRACCMTSCWSRWASSAAGPPASWPA